MFRVDRFSPWKIIKEDAVLIPKHRGENFAIGFLHSEFFGAGWAAMPLLHWLLPPAHSDITRFRSWSPIETENHLDRSEKIPKLLRRLAPLTFMIRVHALRDPLRGELPLVEISTNDGPNSLTWDAQLLSHWFSWNPVVFKISSWILLIISREVTFWVVQDEAHHRWKNHHV